MPDTMARPMYVGLDVHKQTITVAAADGDGREARSLGTMVNNTAAIDRQRKLTAARPRCAGLTSWRRRCWGPNSGI